MRVLLLHNRYRAEGGEERAVAMQAELLSRHGYQVELLERDSSAVGHVAAAGGLLAGGFDPREVGRAVRAFGAEVVHAHNLHPLFGWRALAAARDAGATTLLQLHNFRLFCAIGIAFRDDRPCHECRGLDTLPGLAHRCRGSVLEGLPYAVGLSLQQRRLLWHADRLIALSHGHLALLGEHGLRSEAVSVVPNFVADADWATSSRAGEGRHALVAGRLVEEKGFDVAVQAAAQAGVPLVVAGSGPDRERLERVAAACRAQVSFTGWLAPKVLARYMREAAVVLVPSRCEEAFGYGALDAFAAGVPVIASPRGGLAELVQAGGGALLDPDAVGEWAQVLTELWSDPARRRREGERALVSAREHYGETAAIGALESAYGAAATARRSSASR